MLYRVLKQFKVVTDFYGLELFNSDKILRIAEIFTRPKKRYFLGWKGTDMGHFANIREELQEEVTDGIVNSFILHRLGGGHSFDSLDLVVREIERLGYNQFMDFSGENMVGIHEELDLNVKVMLCPVLKYPLLLEIEKMAVTIEDALEVEKKLQTFVRVHQIQQRVVRQEPPSLLFSTTLSSP